ncbi:DUF2726 domain-containing protein [Acinetobacter sp. MD2]|uniref:DUF2726 domain-containing protein n=1 Tax=Acinetobacter sp. MD2 TaxID=2600066 RepID=UPI002D1EF997|nr:DUF2726 domain-containing protein [Acinetobacter sp. MD2]MEB3766767.1 DUF2726 domain-containing protein [Acinetobacter sp. MD2]
MEFIVLTMISLLILVTFFLRYKRVHSSLHDSVLKQRRILNYNEQLLLSRLSFLRPDYTILSKVSYDALITTKYEHTRHKFNALTADFVVLNERYEVVVVIALYDPVLGVSQQLKSGQYRSHLLSLAGYKTLSYIGVPDEQRLEQDLDIEHREMAFA